MNQGCSIQCRSKQGLGLSIRLKPESEQALHSSGATCSAKPDRTKTAYKFDSMLGLHTALQETLCVGCSNPVQ